MKHEMTVREAGKKGGDKVKATYGTEYYEALGRMGGKATLDKHGPEFYQKIGQKGAEKKRKA